MANAMMTSAENERRQTEVDLAGTDVARARDAQLHEQRMFELETARISAQNWGGLMAGVAPLLAQLVANNGARAPQRRRTGDDAEDQRHQPSSEGGAPASGAGAAN